MDEVRVTNDDIIVRLPKAYEKILPGPSRFLAIGSVVDASRLSDHAEMPVFVLVRHRKQRLGLFRST